MQTQKKTYFLGGDTNQENTCYLPELNQLINMCINQNNCRKKVYYTFNTKFHILNASFI